MLIQSSWRLIFLLFLTSALSCMHDKPKTQVSSLDEQPGCEETKEGNGCLTMEFFAKKSYRESNPEKLKSMLRWALYKDGDVGLFGPGDNQPVYEGFTDDVDLSLLDSTFSTTIPNLKAALYHALALMDLNKNDAGDKGEAVTFPSDAFEVPANRHVQARVRFDYTR